MLTVYLRSAVTSKCRGSYWNRSAAVNCN